MAPLGVGPDPPGEGALLGDGAFRCDAVFRQNTLTTSSGCADDIQMQQLFSVLGVRLGDGVQHDAQLGRARAHRGRPPALDHLVPRQDQRETTARPPVQQHAQNRPVTRSLQLTYLLTYTHTFNGPFSRTTRVGRYQKGKTNLDFTEAKNCEW